MLEAVSSCDARGHRWVQCTRCEYRRYTHWELTKIHHSCPGVRSGHGPGWHLANMLKQLGVKPSSSCECAKKQAEMDRLGVGGCIRDFDKLLAHLRTQYDEASVATKLRAGAQAVRHGLPKTLKGLLAEAIRRSEDEVEGYLGRELYANRP